MGAVIFEGMAKDLKEAEELASNGSAFFPQLTITTLLRRWLALFTSMPVFIIKNEKYGNFAFSNMNEGVGQVKTLRFGANNEEVIRRLEWMKTYAWTCHKIGC